MLPIQDVFGWSDRINVPATVGAENWTYRLPWPVDRLSDIREAREAAERLRRWADESGRIIDSGRSLAWRDKTPAALDDAPIEPAQTRHLR
jgi:hypothetical protein